MLLVDDPLRPIVALVQTSVINICGWRGIRSLLLWFIYRPDWIQRRHTEDGGSNPELVDDLAASNVV